MSNAYALGLRRCIQSNQTDIPTLSGQFALNCDYNAGGCQGATIPEALDWLRDYGVTTTKCDPWKGKEGPCRWPSAEANGCSFYKCGEIRYMTTEFDIKLAILSIGPVVTQMSVYEDFTAYKKGIYYHIGGDFMFTHAVTIYGWGQTKDGTQYWMAASTWGEEWGEKGHFKIVFGEGAIGTFAGTCFAKAQH